MITPGKLPVIVLLILVCGCGYKTAPRPATATIPADVTSIDIRAYPDRIFLRWDTPLANTDGSLLKDISGFKVYRVALKGNEECENCETRKNMYANIDFQNPSNAAIKSGEVSYWDTGVAEGNTYSYAVSTYNLKGREGKLSPDVVVSLNNLPAPPENLKIRGEADRIILDWNDPLKAEGIQGFRIYRGTKSNPTEMTTVGWTKDREFVFADKDVQRDTTYFYTVRSFRLDRGVSLESLPSPVLSAKLGESSAQ